MTSSQWIVSRVYSEAGYLRISPALHLSTARRMNLRWLRWGTPTKRGQHIILFPLYPPLHATTRVIQSANSSTLMAVLLGNWPQHLANGIIQ